MDIICNFYRFSKRFVLSQFNYINKSCKTMTISIFGKIVWNFFAVERWDWGILSQHQNAPGWLQVRPAHRLGNLRAALERVATDLRSGKEKKKQPSEITQWQKHRCQSINYFLPQGSNMAKQISAPYIECSALQSENSVRDIFHVAALACINKSNKNVKRHKSSRATKRSSHMASRAEHDSMSCLHKSKAKTCSVMWRTNRKSFMRWYFTWICFPSGLKTWTWKHFLHFIQIHWIPQDGYTIYRNFEECRSTELATRGTWINEVFIAVPEPDFPFKYMQHGNGGFKYIKQTSSRRKEPFVVIRIPVVSIQNVKAELTPRPCFYFSEINYGCI